MNTLGAVTNAPLGLALAMVSALVYGCADFGGGRATRLASATTVTFTSQLAGLCVVILAAPIVPHGPISTRMLLAGFIGGIAGGSGVMLFYYLLANGTMSIVSPVTAVSAAAVPIVGGLLFGERLRTLALVGLVLAIGAIVLVSLVKGEHDPHASRTVALSVAAGMFFGLFYVALSRSGPKPGVIPFLGARLSSMSIAGALALFRKEPLFVTRKAVPLAAATGIMDMTANVMFLYASLVGLLTITGAVAALYPISTLLLARFVDHERLRPIQWVGLFAALAAIVLISLN
jgi:drug/metabolite transporter (DMT)-like permease